MSIEVLQTDQLAFQFDFIDQPACQVCGGTKSEPFCSLKKFRERSFVWPWDFHFQACQGCGFIYMNPMPSEKSYKDFYEQVYWRIQTHLIQNVENGLRLKDGQKEVFADKDQRLNLRRVPRISRALAEGGIQLKPHHSVIEIGCGWGGSLAHLHQQSGVQVFAVEPSEDARAYMRKAYPFIQVAGKFAEDFYENHDYDGSMDLVIISHCLEMVVDQNALMRALHRLLRKDGVLYIATPNFYWQNALQPVHPFAYTRESLEWMLNKHGFSVMNVQSTPPPARSLTRSLWLWLRHRDPYVTLLARKGAGVGAPRPLGADLGELRRRRLMGERVEKVRVITNRFLDRGVSGIRKAGKVLRR